MTAQIQQRVASILPILVMCCRFLATRTLSSARNVSDINVQGIQGGLLAVH